MSLKGQAIADFIVEFSYIPEEGVPPEKEWIAYVDGSSTR
jgi:hypothetical protein